MRPPPNDVRRAQYNWVAAGRGSLGSHAGFGKLGHAQSHVPRLQPRLGRPIIMAAHDHPHARQAFRKPGHRLWYLRSVGMQRLEHFKVRLG